MRFGILGVFVGAATVAAVVATGAVSVSGANHSPLPPTTCMGSGTAATVTHA
jgi:hypothetical protein